MRTFDGDVDRLGRIIPIELFEIIESEWRVPRRVEVYVLRRHHARTFSRVLFLVFSIVLVHVSASVSLPSRSSLTPRSRSRRTHPASLRMACIHIPPSRVAQARSLTRLARYAQSPRAPSDGLSPAYRYASAPPRLGHAQSPILISVHREQSMARMWNCVSRWCHYVVRVLAALSIMIHAAKTISGVRAAALPTVRFSEGSARACMYRRFINMTPSLLFHGSTTLLIAQAVRSKPFGDAIEHSRWTSTQLNLSVDIAIW